MNEQDENGMTPPAKGGEETEKPARPARKRAVAPEGAPTGTEFIAEKVKILPDSPGVTGLSAAADYLLDNVEAAAA